MAVYHKVVFKPGRNEINSNYCFQVLDECLTRIHDLKVRSLMIYHNDNTIDLICQVSGEDPQRIGIMVASHNEDTVNSLD